MEYSPGEATDLFSPHGYPRALLHGVPIPLGFGCMFQEYPRALLHTPLPEQGWLFPRVYASLNIYA